MDSAVTAPIVLRLYEDDAKIGRLSGYAYPHAWPGGLDLAWADAFEGTLRHELVHVLQGLVFPEPFLLVDRAGTEGVAEAWEDDLTWLPEAHSRQAAALELGLLPEATAFTSIFGFSSLNESMAYQSSSSFFGWLVLSRGWAAFETWHDSGGDFEAAYGADVAELDAQWRAFLEAIPRDARDRAWARRVFDRTLRPSYLADPCPKLGGAGADLRLRARLAREHGGFAEAAEAEEALFEQTPHPVLALAALKHRLSAGQPLQAREVLAALPDELGPNEALERGRLELRLLMQEGAGDEALAPVLDALAALAPDPTLRSLRRLLLSPPPPAAEALLSETVPSSVELRHDALRRALATPDPTARAEALRALSATWPEDEDLALIALGWGGLDLPEPREDLSLPPDFREALAALLATTQRATGGCDLARRELAWAGSRAAQHGDLALTEQVAGVLQADCTEPLARLHGQQLLERVAWERSQPAGAP